MHHVIPLSALQCDVAVWPSCLHKVGGRGLQVQRLSTHQPPARGVFPQTPAALHLPSAGVRVQTLPFKGPHQERPQGETRRVRGRQRAFAHHSAPVLREGGQNPAGAAENTPTEEAKLRNRAC